VIAVVAALASLIISRRISSPLEKMKLSAERFAAGDLNHRLESPGLLEMNTLAEAMNKMAGRLDERIRTIVEQRNEQQAVLSSMIEGVFAVDESERLISMNRSAARLISADPGKVRGKRLQEIVRNSELQRFVERTLRSDTPIEGEILLGDDRDRFVQTHGAVLQGSDGARIGALVVLNDITRIRQLETVRRDFVANVSHELKTPITSIKGYVETLLDGAMHNLDESKRFLEIILKHSDRLNSIIDDLLSLSRIEQEKESGAIVLEEGSIKDVLQNAIRACETKATAKEIEVVLNCSDAVYARINAPLLEQAVVNLVDNAIKYSEPDKIVTVEAESTKGAIEIRVHDQGCGIPKEHLHRLFERFYRVDKARSRKMGGTGLGLAIAKHIIQAHDGRISVASQPGKGSTFTIHIPPA
jgi:two-component system phosphate regulon sensor histidine kinase PhoR